MKRLRHGAASHSRREVIKPSAMPASTKNPLPRSSGPAERVTLTLTLRRSMSPAIFNQKTGHVETNVVQNHCSSSLIALHLPRALTVFYAVFRTAGVAQLVERDVPNLD